jgi:predicted membrane protein (TIGR00267 family)
MEEIEEEDSSSSKMTNSRRMLQAVNEYNTIANISEIARRSFGNNAFDGILTMLGVMMGSFVSDVVDPHIVITTGLSTSIAIMISGGWGAYLTESAERKKDLDELGRSMLADLNGSRIGRAGRFAAIAVAVVDGLSPFLGAIFPLIPFFFSGLFPNIQTVYYTAFGVGLVELFALGLWLGNVAKENLIGYGFKTLLAGVVSMLVGSLLNGK